MVCMYSTLRVVKIPSRCLAITYYIILIVILGYIGGYGVAYSKGYQATCPVQSVVTTKVKGTLVTNFPDKDLAVKNPEWYRRIWDSSDIVIPSHGGESGGFFILTNIHILITPNQTRSICAESQHVRKSECRLDKDCTPNLSIQNGNGVMTGRCVNADNSNRAGVPKTCEVHAWCPTEHHLLPFQGKRALLSGTKDFTVLVKNTIEFPEFGSKTYRRRNIAEKYTEEYLQTCLYDKKKNPYCPTFRIGDIVDGAGFNYDNVALSGGIFAIKIRWDCSFDWGNTIEHCLPKYSFQRLDDDKARIAPGFNFRSVVYHEENRRTLTQNYGLKILIEVEGEGRMFDSIKFLLTVGAGLGFLAFASLICDFLLDLFCKLQTYSKSSSWLQYFSPEMKYDLDHVKNYERAKYSEAQQGTPTDDKGDEII